MPERVDRVAARGGGVGIVRAGYAPPRLSDPFIVPLLTRQSTVVALTADGPAVRRASAAKRLTSRFTLFPPSFARDLVVRMDMTSPGAQCQSPFIVGPPSGTWTVRPMIQPDRAAETCRDQTTVDEIPGGSRITLEHDGWGTTDRAARDDHAGYLDLVPGRPGRPAERRRRRRLARPTADYGGDAARGLFSVR